MSTTHYSPSTSAADTERYIRGKEDERGVAITCDVPGGPGAFSARARALTQNMKRDVEALHYRQSFSDEEFDPKNPEDVQRVNDLGYMLAKKMHPRSDCLVVTHTDGRGGKAHNHVLVINHDNETEKALSDYRTFHDRKAGNQRGVQSANDELMREHGLSVVKQLERAPQDWELRREDFAEGSLDREMGDRMSAALADPRSVDKAGLESVIAEQNQQHHDGKRVPRMRLHTTVSKKGKNAGRETWTLYIEDDRDETKRAERRKRTSALSADFTPEGAQAFFDYHQQQKEQDHERSARQAEAAERAERIAAAARQSRDDGDLELDPRRRRGSEREDRPADRAAEEARGVREGHGRGDEQSHRPGVDLAAVRQHVTADRERREQADRDRADAQRVRAESRREAAAERLAEFDRRSAEESRGYGLGD
ncbi:relaxase/mobilization nuclease domain-containing protein [Luteococcus japonicus]|uniref:relaxase/mobilization nuclease domain-containing protein n=1 Tax=Luteococcus japonicus TaxID=33984 RepID=UPI001C4E2A3C|nr:relaxase/mobilization nuclease domain-containing protein [Luteococcus japonicus]